MWPKNREPLELFLALATQWRVVILSGGMGPGRLEFLGLDYTAAEATMRMLGLKRSRQRQLLLDLRVMERAALEVMNRE